MEIQLTSTAAATGAAAVTARDMTRQTGLARSVILVRALIALCKPRIGLAIALSAVAGAVVAGDGRLGAGPLLVLVVVYLLAHWLTLAVERYVDRPLGGWRTVVFFLEDITPMQALHCALEVERRACDFYVHIAGRTRSPRVQELAQEFAEEEGEHVAHVQRWIERARRMVEP